MPRKKSTAVTRRRSKRRPRRRAVRRPLPLGGFAPSMLVRLKYVETFSLDPSGTISLSQVFRANSLFDPNFTGAGHQPSNFDRLSAIYDRYTVLGAKIQVYPVALGVTAASTPPVVALHLSEAGDDLNSAYTAGGLSNVLEQPRLSRSVSYIGNPALIQKPLMNTFSAKKFFSTPNVVGTTPYSADVGGNPAEGAFFEFIAMSPNDSSDPASYTFRAEIEYIALMTEPKLTDAS